MQLPLSKENDSSKDSGRPNTQQESPPKIREFDLHINSSQVALKQSLVIAEVPDKENQTNDSEVILRRTQSFENDEKWVNLDWNNIWPSFSIFYAFDVNSIN